MELVLSVVLDISGSLNKSIEKTLAQFEPFPKFHIFYDFLS